MCPICKASMAGHKLLLQHYEGARLEKPCASQSPRAARVRVPPADAAPPSPADRSQAPERDVSGRKSVADLETVLIDLRVGDDLSRAARATCVQSPFSQRHSVSSASAARGAQSDERLEIDRLRERDWGSNAATAVDDDRGCRCHRTKTRAIQLYLY